MVSRHCCDSRLLALRDAPLASPRQARRNKPVNPTHHCAQVEVGSANLTCCELPRKAIRRAHCDDTVAVVRFYAIHITHSTTLCTLTGMHEDSPAHLHLRTGGVRPRFPPDTDLTTTPRSCAVAPRDGVPTSATGSTERTDLRIGAVLSAAWLVIWLLVLWLLDLEAHRDHRAIEPRSERSFHHRTRHSLLPSRARVARHPRRATRHQVP